MKILKVFIGIAVFISIGLLSWSYYDGGTDRNKHERALLVLELQYGNIENSMPGGSYIS